MWFKVARGSDVDNRDYCSKDGTFYEFGTRVTIAARVKAGAKKGGAATLKRWKDVMDATKMSNFTYLENTHPDLYLQNHSAIHKVAVRHAPKLPDLDIL